MRRTRLFLAALTALVAAADWPQFLGPERNGTSPEKGLALSWPKGGPKLLWQRDVGEGFAGPVVSGGKLVIFHRVKDEDLVECLDAVNGNPLWKRATKTSYRDQLGKGDGPRATPLVAGGRVYTLAADGRLQCLELADGKPVWHRDLAADYRVPGSYFGVGSSPVLEGDVLAVNVGGRDGAGVVGFHKDSGKELWRATDHAASYASPVAATLDGQRRLVFFTREGLAILGPTDGKVYATKRWRARFDASVNAASPVVADGHIFLSAEYGTGAVLLKVGKAGVEEVWQGDRVLSCHYGTPVLHDGFLYGFDGRQEGGEAELRCVEWRTGKVRWKQGGFGTGSLILADGHLLILGEQGDLVVAEATPAGYREKARATLLRGPVRAQPALAEGRFYARDGGRLGCWSLRRD
jgi:outer membrane protein assembly factor BamB